MFSAARRWPALFQDIISNHGSLAGYNAHRKLGEIPVLCTMCLHARAEASRRSFGRSPGIHET